MQRDEGTPAGERESGRRRGPRLQEPPPWVPDQQAPRCMACGASFTMVRRRHHCRNCGKVSNSLACLIVLHVPWYSSPLKLADLKLFNLSEAFTWNIDIYNNIARAQGPMQWR